MKEFQGKRKFVIVLFVLVGLFVYLPVGWLPAKEFANLLWKILAVFVAGNAAEHLSGIFKK